jgi:hypothetical protein
MKAGEVVQQIAVDEHVTTADFAQQDALGPVVQEGGVAPRDRAVSRQQPANQNMLDAGVAIFDQSDNGV